MIWGYHHLRKHQHPPTHHLKPWSRGTQSNTMLQEQHPEGTCLPRLCQWWKPQHQSVCFVLGSINLIKRYENPVWNGIPPSTPQQNSVWNVWKPTKIGWKISQHQQVGLPYQVSCSCATRAKLRLPGTPTNSYLALAAVKNRACTQKWLTFFQSCFLSLEETVCCCLFVGEVGMMMMMMMMAEFFERGKILRWNWEQVMKVPFRYLFEGIFQGQLKSAKCWNFGNERTLCLLRHIYLTVVFLHELYWILPYSRHISMYIYIFIYMTYKRKISIRNIWIGG